MATLNGFGAITPDAKTPVHDANILFSVATNKVSGKVVVTWQDTRLDPNNALNSVAYTDSNDAAATFSAPVRIDKTPANAAALRTQAFNPTIVAADDGTLAVTYYDFRNDTGGRRAGAGRHLGDLLQAGRDRLLRRRGELGPRAPAHAEIVQPRGRAAGDRRAVPRRLLRPGDTGQEHLAGVRDRDRQAADDAVDAADRAAVAVHLGFTGRRQDSAGSTARVTVGGIGFGGLRAVLRAVFGRL